jgi:hypothetical protein
VTVLLVIAALLALPLMTILVLAIGVLFATDTPRGPNDGWCLTLDPPYRRRIEKKQEDKP